MSSDRILVVEDDVALEGEPLAMKVRKAGYEVVGIAETEEQAVSLAIDEHPGVVLMDIGLPDETGNKDRFAGLRAAQRIRAATGAHIIFITGTLEEPDVLSEAKKTPEYVFLVKPVQDKQLLASIQLAFSKAKRKAPATPSQIIRQKELQSKFDVYVSYNSGDQLIVEAIARQLLAVGIRPWLDKWNLSPGTPAVDALEQAIRTIPCAALCLGPSDIGRWHVIEIRAYIQKWARGDARIIPVLLPGVASPPELPAFVGENVWADMRNWENPASDSLYRLVCGVIGRPPGESPPKKFSARDVAEWQSAKLQGARSGRVGRKQG